MTTSDSETRTYRGSSVDELIPRIQRELGDDAIILRRREGLTGGVLGFFQRSFVEIDAVSGHPRVDVYDEEPIPVARVERSVGAYVTEQLAALAGTGRTDFAEALASAESEPSPPPPQPKPPVQLATPPEPWTVPAPAHEPGRAGAGIEKRLLAVGMGAGFARELIEGASAHVLPLAPGGGLKRGVRTALAQRIPVAPALPVRGAAIVVVGAGGSGKTSYCAALMRAYRRNAVLPARCATLSWSPERAGLHVMLTPHVMWPTPLSAPRAQRALRRVRGEGLLVIDTPRMSPADKAGIRELARLLGELAPERVVVALPATLGAAAAAQLLQALAPLGSNALAVTHTEETDQEGVAVEVACKFGLAPEYRLDRNRAGVWRVGLTDPNTLATRLLP